MNFFEKILDRDSSDDGEYVGKKRGRKKKQIIKPWDRRERIILLIIIALTVGTSALLSLQARSWKLAGIPRIKIPELKLPFLSEETIILEGNKKDQEKMEKVVGQFKDKTKNLSGVYGLYVIRLGNGSSYGVNETETFQAASLVKLPVMVAMYLEAESDNLDLDAKYELKKEDKVGGAGSLYGKSVGYTLSYRGLVELMGKQSDNTAFNIAKNFLGSEKIDQVVGQIGMTKMDLVENETTPYDVGVFFEQFWKANIVSGESRDEILNFLTDTIYEEHLAAGIPDNVRVAHKYGREVHVVNDAGIVFLDDPIVVVIMSKGVVEKEADEIFPELARMVYEIEAK